MFLRIAILILSLAYGIILLVGAGFLTGGGHAVLALVPLATGPLGYIPAHFSSAFHDPNSSLISYARTADQVVFILAVIGWPVAAGFAAWRARRSFMILMGLYYLAIVASWMYMVVDSPRYLIKVESLFHMVSVLVYILFFIGGQTALWRIHSGRSFPKLNNKGRSEVGA